jgi:hypothetical protein
MGHTIYRVSQEFKPLQVVYGRRFNPFALAV